VQGLSRLALCYIVSVLLTVAWVVFTPTGFVLFFSRAGYDVWRLGRVAIAGLASPGAYGVDMHSYSSIAFTVLGAIHFLVKLEMGCRIH